MSATFTKDAHEWVNIICGHCGNEIDIPVYCGDRFCPVCSLPRRLKIRARMQWLVSQFKPRKGVRLKQLTLTIRNQEDLPAMLTHLVKSFRRLRQRKFWKNNVHGGCFVLEVTGRPGNWHAHIHAVIEAYFVVFSRLLKLWEEVSGGHGVYVQALPHKQILNHLTKYLTKPDIPDVVEAEIGAALKGYRLFQPFGSWYAINLKYEKPSFPCPKCGEQLWIPGFLLEKSLTPASATPVEPPIYMEH